MANIKSRRDDLGTVSSKTNSGSYGVTGTRTGSVSPNASYIDPVDTYMQNLSANDKTLPADAQRGIAQQKLNYANATTDAERNAAHNAAEALRYNNGGYYAGRSGNDYITKDSVYTSNADQKHFSPEQMADTTQNKMKVLAGLMTTEDANAMAEAEREQYGYSGGKYGDQYIRLKNADGSNRFTYDGLPDSVNRYQQMIQQMSDRLLNQEAFSYDPYQDPLYQLYAQQYTSGGQSAMQNTLAQIAARTGGLASSYAGTAAQNAYNGYMTQLANKIPELYQMAYGMYRDRQNDMRDNLSLLQNLSDADYNRYANERNFAYQNYLGNRDYDYQYNRDRSEDARADYQFETQMNQQALETAIDALLNGTNVFGGLAADGVDPNAYYALMQQYLPNMIENRWWPGTL